VVRVGHLFEMPPASARFSWVVFMHHHFPSPSASSGRLRCLARVLFGAVALVALGACSGFRDKLPSVPSVGSIVTPYKIDIVQGNVVTREQAPA
jgi:outer membrane protein assembly factor BamE